MSHAHCNSIAPPEATGERPFWGSINEEHEVPCRSTISNVIKRHNFFFRADTKPFKRRSKSGVRAFERREPGEGRAVAEKREYNPAVDKAKDTEGQAVRGANDLDPADGVPRLFDRTHECQRASGRNRPVTQIIPLIPPS